MIKNNKILSFVHNEANIPEEWIKPECWPENKTLGFIRSKNGNVLFHVLNDYSYNNMISELAFRVDYLSERLEELEGEEVDKT